MDAKILEEAIRPFFWIEHENSVSVCLNAEGLIEDYGASAKKEEQHASKNNY